MFLFWRCCCWCCCCRLFAGATGSFGAGRGSGRFGMSGAAVTGSPIIGRWGRCSTPCARWRKASMVELQGLLVITVVWNKKITNEDAVNFRVFISSVHVEQLDSCIQRFFLTNNTFCIITAAKVQIDPWQRTKLQPRQTTHSGSESRDC
jgi:hypothetical protein